METLLIWGLVLIGAAILLVVLEMFVPSGGTLGVTAGVLAIAGIICNFRADTTWGLISLGVVVVLGPFMGWMALRIWPSTPMGRRFIGAPSDDELERQRLAQEEERQRRQALIGVEGVVLTDLRPVGIVDIKGQRFDALSETHFIPAGSRVRVTHLDGLQIKVRPVT
jgi:membrane-bound ClpP family serine protease